MKLGQNLKLMVHAFKGKNNMACVTIKFNLNLPQKSRALVAPGVEVEVDESQVLIEKGLLINSSSSGFSDYLNTPKAQAQKRPTIKN